MSPWQPLTEALAGLVALPFVVAGLLWRGARGLWRLRQNWRRYVPLQTKNQVRAGVGAGGLALCATCYSQILALPNGTAILAAAVPLSMLYLVAGAIGAVRAVRFDFFSAFWFAAAALACAAFLICGKIPGLSWALN